MVCSQIVLFISNKSYIRLKQQKLIITYILMHNRVINCNKITSGKFNMQIYNNFSGPGVPPGALKKKRPIPPVPKSPKGPSSAVNIPGPTAVSHAPPVPSRGDNSQSPPGISPRPNLQRNISSNTGLMTASYKSPLGEFSANSQQGECNHNAITFCHCLTFLRFGTEKSNDSNCHESIATHNSAVECRRR